MSKASFSSTLCFLDTICLNPGSFFQRSLAFGWTLTKDLKFLKVITGFSIDGGIGVPFSGCFTWGVFSFLHRYLPCSCFFVHLVVSPRHMPPDAFLSPPRQSPISGLPLPSLSHVLKNKIEKWDQSNVHVAPAHGRTAKKYEADTLTYLMDMRVVTMFPSIFSGRSVKIWILKSGPYGPKSPF
jgi:hypothetical protein